MTSNHQPSPVSVLIATRGLASTIRNAVESVLKCNPLEVIVITMKPLTEASLPNDGRIRVILKPDAKLSEQRNFGVRASSGSIVAFTDDDCTVKADWMSSAMDQFANEKVGVVGGPGLTHPSDPPLARCSGAVLASLLGTYTSSSRYTVRPRRAREADERNLSTCNLFFRRSALAAVGLFSPDQVPCDESELIQRIKAAGLAVLYEPRCVVYHHRRPLFRPFLKQIKWYAFGRAVFTLRYPKEFRAIIAAPSLLVVATLLTPILYFQSPLAFRFLLAGFGVYLAIALLCAVRSTVASRLSLRYVGAVWGGIVAMHYCYGLCFLLNLGKMFRVFHR